MVQSHDDVDVNSFGGVDEGGAADQTGASCKADYPASQSLSAPCCTERGPDACGAGLFCAAFDGRSQATCYPEHVRLGGESCTADVQCLGGACHPSGVCRCAPTDPACTAVGPDARSPKPGKCPSSCTTDADCQATCPPLPAAGSICCDTATRLCYGTNMQHCPLPVP